LVSPFNSVGGVAGVWDPNTDVVAGCGAVDVPKLNDGVVDVAVLKRLGVCVAPNSDVLLDVDLLVLDRFLHVKV
jgi:hypothetical protein